MKLVDLRSDTVTRPTDGMRRAMAQAEVGDDVYGEDPTVNRLQEAAAGLFDREAALFVPSGVMGNQIALAVHTRPGDEVILDSQSHIYNFEMATMSRFSGLLARPLDAPRGVLPVARVREAIRPDAYYLSRTSLVAAEDTHNLRGGAIYPPEAFESLARVAHEHGIPVHLDGARIFNAAVALGRSVADLTRPADSVMFCLSKGLGAPIGSVLVGSRAFIDEARRVRKALGGGMRQAGILAAAGIYALEHHVERLAVDHEHARLLGIALSEIGFSVEPVETNIVIFSIERKDLGVPELQERLRRHGVLASPAGGNPRKMRLVTHLDVTRPDIDLAIAALRSAAKETQIPLPPERGASSP